MKDKRTKYVSMQQRICFQTFRLALKRAVLDKKIETRFIVYKICPSAINRYEMHKEKEAKH